MLRKPDVLLHEHLLSLGIYMIDRIKEEYKNLHRVQQVVMY